MLVRRPKFAIVLAALLLPGLARPWANPATGAVPPTLACVPSGAGDLVQCDYRTFGPARVRQLRVQIDGTARPSHGASLYPSPGQVSAVLFLIDVSDPARATTVARNVATVRAMIARLQPHQHAGLAVFDTDLRMLAPVGSPSRALDAALNSVRAGGLATEFYKSVIHAETELGKIAADRRALVLLSDGKAEDRAYRPEDAIAAARAAHVAIIGLGYAERPQDAPDLQSLEQLADATQGAWYDMSGQDGPPAALRDRPLAVVEGGGRFTLDGTDLFGRHQIVAEFKLDNGERLSAQGEIDFNAGRGWIASARALLIDKAPWLAGGLAVVFMIVVGVLIWRRRRRAAPGPLAPRAFGVLEELDGAGTRHVLRASALRLGRGHDSDIRLRNTSVSQNHAALTRRGDDWQIVDLGSSNGVLVNGRPVTQALLHHGDVIELGEVRMRLAIAIDGDHAREDNHEW